MIDLLKTVLGAVATKDIVPVLNNFCLYKSLFNKESRIQGSNGILYIDAAFPHPISEITVPANKFIKAIEACDGMPDFSITEAGRLSIKRGRFRAYLPTLPSADYPVASQEGTLVSITPSFVDTLRTVKPFISEDASRVWSMSLLLSSDGYIYATNNIIIVRKKFELDFDGEIVLPVDAINRILDIDQTPTACYVSEMSFTLEYGPDMWMRTQLITERWPTVRALFADFKVDVPVPPDLKKAVDRVRHFCANEKFPVIKLGTAVSTDGEVDGASMDGFDLPESSFHADQLIKVLSVATHIDFSSFPKPCFFKGANGLEGMIVGIRT